MIDTRIRARIDPVLNGIGSRLNRRGVRAGHATAIGLLAGLAAALAAGLQHWWIALALWLANRLVDGIDGPIARAGAPTPLGGYLDFVADYVVYVSIPVAIALALPNTRLAITVMLAAFLLNIVQLLTLSSIAEQQQRARADGRALHFSHGLVEGAETIVAYALALALPSHAGTIFYAFAIMVLITAAQRFLDALRELA
ncbi:MAG: CDP-alcohol phosphatidyltransferase family protein [Gaiellales bacterium]